MYAGFVEVFGEIFGHFLGERGDEYAVAAIDDGFDFGDGVIDLAHGGMDIEDGIEQAGGADDLFDDFAFGLFDFVVTGGG